MYEVQIKNELSKPWVNLLTARTPEPAFWFYSDIVKDSAFPYIRLLDTDKDIVITEYDGSSLHRSLSRAT